MTQRERQILTWIQEDPMISQEALAQRAGITRSCVAAHISNLTKKGYIAGKGYVLRDGNYAVVVGGINIDIGGKAYAPLVERDSNPGQVHMSLGGVGRNIAHNMSLLGLEVRMLTALGDDFHAQKIKNSCNDLGIDLSYALHVPNGTTSTYVYLSGPDGDMALAVSDMQICEQITPAYLASRLNLLNNAKLVVADANLPPQSLHYLAESCTAPLFVDPVSTHKAEKLRPILSGIHTLKPNRLEAELLTGIRITDRDALEQATKCLLDSGIRRVFLSLGNDGVYAAEGEERHLVPCCPAEMRNATGAGDAFMAGLTWAWMEGLSLRETAQAGAAAGAIAIEAEETINSNLNVTALRERMGQIL